MAPSEEPGQHAPAMAVAKRARVPKTQGPTALEQASLASSRLQANGYRSPAMAARPVVLHRVAAVVQVTWKEAAVVAAVAAVVAVAEVVLAAELAQQFCRLTPRSRWLTALERSTKAESVARAASVRMAVLAVLAGRAQATDVRAALAARGHKAAAVAAVPVVYPSVYSTEVSSLTLAA
jgi:hypothetical protein